MLRDLMASATILTAGQQDAIADVVSKPREILIGNALILLDVCLTPLICATKTWQANFLYLAASPDGLARIQ